MKLLKRFTIILFITLLISGCTRIRKLRPVKLYTLNISEIGKIPVYNKKYNNIFFTTNNFNFDNFYDFNNHHLAVINNYASQMLIKSGKKSYVLTNDIFSSVIYHKIFNHEIFLINFDKLNKQFNFYDYDLNKKEIKKNGSIFLSNVIRQGERLNIQLQNRSFEIKNCTRDKKQNTIIILKNYVLIKVSSYGQITNYFIDKAFIDNTSNVAISKTNTNAILHYSIGLKETDFLYNIYLNMQRAGNYQILIQKYNYKNQNRTFIKKISAKEKIFFDIFDERHVILSSYSTSDNSLVFYYYPFKNSNERFKLKLDLNQSTMLYDFKLLNNSFCSIAADYPELSFIQWQE